MTYKEFALIQALILYQLTKRLVVTDLFQAEITRLPNLRIHDKSILGKFYGGSLICSSNYPPKIRVFQVKRSKINFYYGSLVGSFSYEGSEVKSKIRSSKIDSYYGSLVSSFNYKGSKVRSEIRSLKIHFQ